MSRDSWKRYGVKNNKVSKFMNYDVVDVGFKYNMTDMTAAMGLVQLKKIILMWRERNLINKYYFKELKNLPIKFQTKTSTKISHTSTKTSITPPPAPLQKLLQNLFYIFEKSPPRKHVQKHCK